MPCCRKETARCAAVLFGLKFADNIHYTSLRVAQLRKPDFRAPKRTGEKQNLTQNGHSRTHVLESVERRSGLVLLYNNVGLISLSVPLLQHSTGKIINPLASFCLSVCLSALLYGHTFCSILMKFCTEVGGPKSKKAFVRGSKSDDSFPYFAPIFHPCNAFSMGRSKYHSNKARGPIVTVKSSNSVPRERLQAQSCKML